MTATKETIAFQAETKELLHLVIHSLYTHKEIFLRELISNASDAIDKRRVESLTSKELAEGWEPAIYLAVEPEERRLTIVDNGIGMSRDEVVANIGTIARSGTKGFLQALQDAKSGKGELPELIGQFGVGFYSAFMVADEVVLETRRADEPDPQKGVRWTSGGGGDFTIEEVEVDEPGTRISLHLKQPEEGEDTSLDFTNEQVLRGIVKRYSDFIAHPIGMDVGEGDDRHLEVLNSQKPLWTRPKHEIESDEYVEFYKHTSHDWNDPLETVHFRAEGATEYTALLFVPSQRPLDLFDPQGKKSHVQLYVKRTFIMADCEELAPVWLRFVRGVVDSADLPLNISRETLQHNRQMGQIKKRVTRKVLDALEGMLKDRREDYLKFWAAFGPVLKEGIYYDDGYGEDVAKLSLFASTAGDEPTTLEEYVERMPVKQKQIYVLVARDVPAARRSRHLEAFRSKGFEVLFLTDPVDEFVLQRMKTFQERDIRQIDKGEVDLGDEGEKEEREAKEKELEPLLESVRKELSDHVESVRFSSRLTDSPACLVSGEHDLSPQMERFLRESGQPIPERKRVLELNAGHPLVERLQQLSSDDATFARFGDYCELLYEGALIAEGSPVSDPQRFNQLVADLMLGGAPAS